jgi:arylsulfatase A-like enzyme
LAGVKDKLPEKIDGGNLTSLLRGEMKPLQRRNEGLLFHFPHYQGVTPQSSIRVGDFKLIYNYEDRSRKLFHLRNDPAERNDLSKSRKEDADRLEAQLHSRLVEAGAAMPKPNPNFDAAAEPSVRKGRKTKKEKP